MAKTSAILYSPDGVAPPDVVQRWLDALGVPIVTVDDADALMGASLRSRPRVVVFDSRHRTTDVLEALLDQAAPARDVDAVRGAGEFAKQRRHVHAVGVGAQMPEHLRRRHLDE